MGELSERYAQASESLVGLTSNVDAGRNAGKACRRWARTSPRSMRCTNATARKPREARGRQPDVRRVGELLENLRNSVDDTKRYKDNIAELSENLSKLNTVYGNMLAAMSVNR